MNESGVEILLVEDNPDDVELTLHAFKKNNVTNRISVVRDGIEALDFIFGTGAGEDQPAQQSPKVILLDLKLPKMNGLEVLRRIKADPRTQHIPVVMLTSSAEERDIATSYHIGANSYIVKPVNFDHFVEAVRQLGFYWMLLNRAPAAIPA
jgi:two-component system, response regulator